MLFGRLKKFMVQNQILDQLHDVGYVMCNVERYFKDLKIFYLFK